MTTSSPPPLPPGAQVNQEEWEGFYAEFGHAKYRRAVRVMSRLPSAPHCEACGSPFGGVGGRIMRRMGKGPSRKNPRWCELCFEKSPGGGATLTVGVLFADLRNSTALAERTSPRHMVDLLNRFYSDTTKVIVQHGIVDKLIGDEVMGVYIPALTPGGRFVDALVADARLILRTAGYGGRDQPRLELGIGLAVGPAFVGHVGDGEVRDFTAIGDAVNTAARLQALAAGGEIVATEDVARQAGLDPSDGEARVVEVRGKAEPVAVRVLTASVLVG